MSLPEEILEGLDVEQRRAATALHGPVCILAGAGTGKTRAITHRIAYGVATGAYSPFHTLALTFTSKAAAEMRARLRVLGAGGVQARTFHAAALKQLSYFWPQAISGPMFGLLEHKIRLIIDAANRLRMSTDRATVRDLAGEIEWAKISMLTPETYQHQAGHRPLPSGWDPLLFSRLFQAYEDLKADQRLMDFHDVLLLMVGILESEPAIAAEVRRQYRVFIVDEYQDVSPLQQRLLEAWLGDSHELCVVGDASQTIYSFTGATSRFLLEFTTTYPQAQRIELIRDYRSTPHIVALANRLLEQRTQQGQQAGGRMPRWPRPLELVSQRDNGPAPVFWECEDEQTEADQIASHIHQQITDGKLPENIAVLFRTNAQSVHFEQALTRHSVPYQLRGAEGFFQRTEVREAVLQLRSAAQASPAVRGEQVVELMEAILTSLGYSTDPPQATGAVRQKWEALDALITLGRRMLDDHGAQLSLDQVVQELQHRDTDEHPPTVSGVTLASLHSAKGLEWDAVYLAGLTEGMVPIGFAQTQSEIDEERRLFYVGITRARNEIFFSWPRHRNGRTGNKSKPSRFLSALIPQASSTQTIPSPHTGVSASNQAQRSSPGDFHGKRRGRSQVAQCRVCGQPLETPVARKLGRCQNCPATYDQHLLDTLKEWRSTTAKSEKLPAMMVFTDATLVAIAEKVPQTASALRQVPGIGDAKLSKYGDAVLHLVSSAPREEDQNG